EEGKYDGSRVWGKHVIRYGATFNRIVGARLAALSAFPQVGTTSLGNSASSDPTSYAADFVSLGNGIGATTAKGEFGFPAGGLGPDNRVEMYVGDRWVVRPKLTLTYGLHYVRDTGRTDSNLGALPALNQLGPGYGNQIRNPNLNFAPQVGFAWDMGGNGKTVLRGGGGLFYEKSLWSNMLFDSPARLAKGVFANTPEVCSGGVPQPFTWPTSPGGVGSPVAGTAAIVTGPNQVTPNFCANANGSGVSNAIPITIAQAAPQILALSSAFQAATASVAGPQQANPNFLGTTLTA